MTVNRFCLVDDVERAVAIAEDFSRAESRVEPAYAVRRGGRKKAERSNMKPVCA